MANLSPTKRILEYLELEYGQQRDKALAEVDKAARQVAPFFANDGTKEYVNQVGAQFKSVLAEQQRQAIGNARFARDTSLKSLRVTVEAAVKEIREPHAGLRHELRLKLAPAASADTESAMIEALRRVGSVDDVERLWSDAWAAKDNTACYWLERHAAEHLTNTDVQQRWNGVAADRTYSRLEASGGNAFRRICDDEQQIAEAVHLIQEHPLASEVEHAMSAMGFQNADDKLLQQFGFARWSIPPAPILD